MNSSPQRPLGVAVLEDLPDVNGKAVLVRATLDLPLGEGAGSPIAGLRARLLGSTLQWLTGHGARVTVFGDSGDAHTVAREEAEGLRAALGSLAPGVQLAGVEGSAEDPATIDRLVGSHDVFVNDSFQWSYLPLPSLMVGARRLPAAAGRSLEHDLRLAAALLRDPPRPFVAVLGGDRTFLRLHGLRGLILRADTVLVGGAMSLPLLQGTGVMPAAGADTDFLAECRSVVGLAGRVQHAVDLPLDLVVSRPDGSVEVAPPTRPPGGEVLDIGPLTGLRFGEVVRGAGTVLWSGGLGKVEDPRFAAGTLAVAEGLTGGDSALTVVGGEALAALLDREGKLHDEGIITATDALLELLKNGDLPALAPLRAS